MAAVAVASSLAFAGTGLAGHAKADDVDEAFINTLDSYGMQYGSPKKAIMVAKIFVCGSIDADRSATFTDVVYTVADNTNWSNADSTYFAGAAIAAYCPQYRYKVRDSS